MKLTDVLIWFGIKVRMCANGSKIMQGLDFVVSYTLTVDTSPFRLSICIAASDEIIVVFIDKSKTFQTNSISDPKKRAYIMISTYL